MSHPEFKRISALSIGAESRRSSTASTAQDIHWLRENIPCQAACPAGTDIPGYLEAIFHGRFQDAYEINLRDNVFPAVLGRVCSRPCEGACRHGWAGNGESVAICFSKRSAADFNHRQRIVLPPLLPPSGRRVAIVGGGVAGLTAARELARLGHAVTVYEKHERPGGMLYQGIPAFRLPRDIIDFEIDQALASGIELRCRVAVGRDLRFAQLLDDFEAIVLAAGTLRPNILDLPGHNLGGVEHGLGFLLGVNEFNRREIGRRVVVIGGGYTAMDCARTAIRLGAASVAVYYRRRRAEMVVLPGELEEFVEEGGGLHNECMPVKVLGSNDGPAAVRFVRTRPGERNRDGRPPPVEIGGSDFEIEADSVILATGQFPDTGWIDRGLARQLVGQDQWLSSGAAQQTAHPKIFVAGDFALGATTIIQAIGHAKECAAQVHQYLTGTASRRPVALVSPSFQSKLPGGKTTGRTPDMNAIPVHRMPTLPPNRRAFADEVETGYEQPQALLEASRCYLCHYKFEIVDAKCVLCDECLKVKPLPGCIVEVAALLRDDEGRITGYRKVEPGKTDSLYYNRLWIDQTQCVRCGQCEAVCPVNAISIQKVSFETRLA